MKTIRRGAYIDAAAVGDLQRALDQLPAEGGVVHLPAGEYALERTVRVRLAEKQHVCLEGEGRSTVIRYTATDGSPLLSLDGVPNSWWPDLKITIRDIVFTGNHECGDALLLRWPNDTLVDACSFHGFGGTAIVITPNATNVTIRDCWMRDCRRVLHADNLHHLTFHGNQTRSDNNSPMKQKEHIYIGRHCREVRIVNNHLAYGQSEGIILDGTAQHIVANNTIEGFPVGIRAVGCRDISLTSNYIHCPVGIHLEGDNRGLIITSNIMTDNHEAAVRIRHPGTSGGHVIAANVMRRSVYQDGQQGIDLSTAEDCIVADNLLEDLTCERAVTGPPEGAGSNRIAGNLIADTARRAARGLSQNAAPTKPLACPPALVPLRDFLGALPATTDRLTLTFSRITEILDDALPPDAYEKTGWWANDPSMPQARAWLEAGWLVAITKRIEGRIVFARIPAGA